ncbi:RNA-directed DNA polymerase, eukaryota, reverse transcriptase zinc-binding domain protein [Tanacetum coccineum]
MPTVGRTSQQFFELQNLLQNLEWSDNEDTWIWDLDHNGLFSVSSARVHIDNVILHSGDRATRWNNCVPIKVNILGWRINLDRLPTRKILVEKGIDLPSFLCPMCGDYTTTNDLLEDKYYAMLTLPRSWSGRTSNAQTGSNFSNKAEGQL